jgi:DNA repair protein RecO (recombination protein O)
VYIWILATAPGFPTPAESTLEGVAGRSYKTEAVVLRSFRFGEADRVLHVYTLDRGRVGAVAKGVRKTKSRFGARLEPLSHAELILHQGGGELQTVTGAELIRSHRKTREEPYRLGVGLIGAEAMLRLFPEQEANERAFRALTRFLDLLDELEPGANGGGSVDPLVLSFQLKLLWVSGYLPHVTSCAECGAGAELTAYSPAVGGAVCRSCANGGGFPLSSEGLSAIDALLRRPLDGAATAGVGARGAREALSVITASYEYHGGFRMRTLAS